MDLGLERAGMSCSWQVEIDPYARKVLAKNWPSVLQFYDVREVGKYNLEPVDLICGGFPCQDISNAGKRAGIDGEKSGLWQEFARIIEEMRPAWVLIENVAALRGRGLQRILCDLSARGYDAEWDCLPASAFGAPHQRDRIFIVAHSQRDLLRDEPGRGSGTNGTDSSIFTNDGESRDVAYPEGARGRRLSVRSGRPLETSTNIERSGQDVADSGNGWKQGRTSAGEDFRIFGGRSDARFDYWEVEPDVGRVVNGVPSRVDRLKCLGNAVVPQIIEWIGRRILCP